MLKKLNDSLIAVVNLLSDGEYHDGTTIGKTLGLTRSAVWKAIKKLQTYDVDILSSKGKGYRLQEPLQLLDAKKILQLVGDHKIMLHVFESLPSTSDYLQTSKKSKAIQICLAEQQTSGRGRFDREWFSPFAKNIYFSCLYPFQKDISELAGLSLVVGLSIVRTLKELGIDKQLAVKWPNDIIYKEQKLSGNLIAIQAEAHNNCFAIIGIGINVNMLGANISQPWTSMQKILGHYVDRNVVCATLIKNLLSYLQQFNQQGFAAFTKEWMQADCLMGKAIGLKNLDNTINGEVVGVNEQGCLLLKLSNGKVQAFSSGDTSVVK